MKKPIAANTDRTLMRIRQATSAASSRYSIGGVKKEGHFAPRPITLPKMPWDDEKSPIQPPQTINIDWPTVLKIWRATGRWNHEAYGPEPGQPGSKAPPQK